MHMVLKISESVAYVKFFGEIIIVMRQKKYKYQFNKLPIHSGFCTNSEFCLIALAAIIEIIIIYLKCICYIQDKINEQK